MSGGSRSTWLRGGKGILSWTAATYLVVLPLGSFFILPVGDVHAAGGDLLLFVLLLVGGATLIRSPGFRATVFRGAAGGWRHLGGGGLVGLSAMAGSARSGGSAGSAGSAGSVDASGGAVGAGAGVAAALLLLIFYGVWAAASGAWGFHPLYSVVKGVGYLALTVGAGAIAWSGLEWDRALDAWLLGTLLAVAVSLALAGVAVLIGGGGEGVGATVGLASGVGVSGARGAMTGAAGGAGPFAWAQRALYEGGSLMGLPGRRLRGPFLHPNGFGDYLVISGALLWARWPALRSPSRGAPLRVPSWLLWSGAGALGVALVLTLSSAWVAAGILLLLWGRRLGSLALRALGGLVAATTFAALVFPLRIGVGDLQVVTSGIRVRIWEDAVRTFLESPVIGVGAAPVLAAAVDPLDPASGPQLWDAHNAYLSVLGQFGVVGFLLVGGATFLVVRSLVRARSRGSAVVTGGASDPPAEEPVSDGSHGPRLLARARRGVAAALVAVAVHGLVIAGEDFRHWWALLPLAGLAVGGAWDWREEKEGPRDQVGWGAA